jgi:proteasome assembly chaperone (PAC2) family protein
MDPVIWSDKPALRNPVFVASFKGWNDAAESATAARGFLIESFDAEQVGRIDPEEFFDFSAVRPTIRLQEGLTRVIEWPEWTIHAAEVHGSERDLVMLQGVEPSLKWRTFCDAVLGVANTLGARTVITLGALLADVPHTRPTNVTGISADAALVARLGLQTTSYEGPTGIVGVLHAACRDKDLQSASLWASVPHYVAAAPNPKAALALIRGFEGVSGVVVEAGALEEAAEEYERTVSAAVASDPEVKAFVERLEQAMDEADEDAPPSADQIPSAESIARDFQNFRRQKGPE